MVDSKVIEPYYQDKKIVQEIIERGPKKVLIIFWHGLGDLVMFLNPYDRLKEQFPEVKFELAVQEGLSFEDIVPDAIFINGDYLDTLEEKDYDLIAKVHFHMSEHQTELTKGEWCCIHELGITPVNGHKYVGEGKNRLIGVHFNITCLPEACRPDDETAKRIWQDIIDAGFIPIETHFQHTFHNPVNTKFDFVDCTVRKAKAKISSLVGLINGLAGFVGVVSGNMHVALANLPESRIFYLEKDLRLECFTKHKVAKASIKPGQYKGEVKQWLQNLHI